jgi:hypothetical protein
MATDLFKQAIREYLDNRAKSDALFAERYGNEKKNIDDCCAYIINEVHKSGKKGFADEEIFGMAVHYYDEEKIDVGNRKRTASVVINHTVEAKAVEAKTQEQKPAEQKAAGKRKQPPAEEGGMQQGFLFDI